MIALVAVIVIVGIVVISIVGSVLNPPQQKKIIEEDDRDTYKWCEENYLELGHSSVIKCVIAENLKVRHNP